MHGTILTMKGIILKAIRFYQKFLSLDTGVFRLRSGICRFTPTCSEYTYQAVTRYGIIYGLWLGLRRIIRCHPFSKSGFDPVPKKATRNKRQGTS
jgi:uncharacterized protein